MNRTKYSPIFKIIIFSGILLFLHWLVFQLPSLEALQASFFYKLPLVYGFVALLSTIMMLVLIRIKTKAPEQLGYTFLLGTSIKMALCYLFLLPVLNRTGSAVYAEKINFFMIFILFLAMEAFFTTRLLNNKQ